MKKLIELHEKNIEYTLRVNKRARNMRLSIYGDGAFVVTVPRIMSESLIEKFIREKSEWVIGKLEYFKKFPGTVFAKGSKKEFYLYKEQALVLAKSRISYFNEFYGFKVNKVSIKNQKTRWGSCSQKGNLNLNYKIALLPLRLTDYIIVHEICHLEEFNHSQKFWNLVAKTIPNHTEIRNELKKPR